MCTPIELSLDTYRGADKSLARPTSPCILFDGEKISFVASLVTYINSTNIPPIMIINRIFFFLALQPSLGVVFYSPLAGFSLLACELS